MFGQVNTIFDPENLAAENPTEVDPETLVVTVKLKQEQPSESEALSNVAQPIETAKPSAGIRDAIEDMYDALTALEKHVMISRERKVLVTTPYAIYQEI